MKRTTLIAISLAALGLAFVTTACSTAPRATTWAANRAPVYALVVSVNGGQPPTDAQWTVLQQKFAAMLASRGMVLVTDPTFADKLIHVQFFPDGDDPTSGSVYVVGVRDNPASSIAVATRTVPASYGYASYSGGMNYPYGGYYPEYYGYYNDYSYSYGSPVAVTKPGSPPPTRHDGVHHTTRPVDCPPDTPNRPPSSFAGNHPTHPHQPPGDGHRPWWSFLRPQPSSSPSYSSSSSSSSPVYSSPAPSYSSSSSYSAPSISMSSSSSSSSYSAPVYSSPSSDSSSSSSAPSISMSSGSSSSGGGSPTIEQPR